MTRKKGRLNQFSRRVTGGKLALGGGRRPRRSRRLKLYESSASFALPKAPRPSLAALRKRLWLPVALLALAGLLYLAFGTTWFYVYDIELAGNQQISKEEIYQRSNLEAMSLFWVNPMAVRRRLLEEPAIAQADVSLRLPNRVAITIEERQPVALWESGDVQLLVDESGTLFRPRGDATQMLRVRDLNGDSVVPGDTVDATVVRAVAALAAEVPERSAFDWSLADGLSFVSDDGYRVNFGDQSQMALKVAAFAAFREQAQPEGNVVLLDLSEPNRPYYRVGP